MGCLYDGSKPKRVRLGVTESSERIWLTVQPNYTLSLLKSWKGGTLFWIAVLPIHRRNRCMFLVNQYAFYAEYFILLSQPFLTREPSRDKVIPLNEVSKSTFPIWKVFWQGNSLGFPPHSKAFPPFFSAEKFPGLGNTLPLPSPSMERLSSGFTWNLLAYLQAWENQIFDFLYSLCPVLWTASTIPTYAKFKSWSVPPAYTGLLASHCMPLPWNMAWNLRASVV